MGRMERTGVEQADTLQDSRTERPMLPPVRPPAHGIPSGGLPSERWRNVGVDRVGITHQWQS